MTYMCNIKEVKFCETQKWHKCIILPVLGLHRAGHYQVQPKNVLLPTVIAKISLRRDFTFTEAVIINNINKYNNVKRIDDIHV